MSDDKVTIFINDNSKGKQGKVIISLAQTSAKLVEAVAKQFGYKNKY